MVNSKKTGYYSALFRKYSAKHVIANSEGAWQSRGCGVYSEGQNRDCVVAITPRNDK